MTKRFWGELKYKIADTFFANELDEAYESGIRLGASVSYADLKRRIREVSKSKAVEEAIFASQEMMEEKVGPLL